MENLTTIDLIDEYFYNVSNKNALCKESNDAELYLNAFQQMTKFVPIKKQRINFESDIWDLRPFFPDLNSFQYKIFFYRLPNDLKEYAKLSFLYRMMGPTKITTLSGQISLLSTIIDGMLSEHNNRNWRSFTTEDYIKFITNRCASDGHKHGMFLAIYWIYRFMSINLNLKFDVDLDQIKNLCGIYKKRGKQTSVKIANIPQKYFVEIVNRCMQIMKNYAIPANDRAMAAFIIILSQTGIRINDLLCIDSNCLKKYSIESINKQWYMLEFAARKPSKAHKPLLKFQTIVTKKCKDAIDELLKIKKERKKDSKNFLFTFESKTLRSLRYPISGAIWKRHYHLFMLKYFKDECLKKWDGINTVKLYLNRVKGPNGPIYTYEMINVPDSRQYRVHICTELYYLDCPLDWIMQFMGHLSQYMTAYYVRPKDDFQENYNYSINVVKNIVQNDISPIGINGEQIKKALKKFAKKSGLSIYKDIDELMYKLGNKFVVRAKSGGVCCIKTSIVQCSEDRMTDKLLCAYNLCPNIFHFFWMLDETYLNFKTSIETYKYNLKNGFLCEAEKEKNKIKGICEYRLIPELKQLDEYIQKNTLQKTLNQFPELCKIIENKTKILDEVNVWMKNK